MPGRPIPREMRVPVMQPNLPQIAGAIIRGPCWVIDGDTIVIDKVHIRLAGIDAPELDHPWGQQSKWALVKLCKGQIVTALIKPEMSYDRLVAECLLPDGRDLAAEMVRAGLALDWPKFSGGKYRSLEQADARKKLWRATLRQRGISPPPATGNAIATRSARPAPEQWHPARSPDTAGPKRALYRMGWLILPCAIALLVGCNLIAVDTDQPLPASSIRQAAAFASFEVTAAVLNVRKAPAGNAGVIAQIARGTMVVPKRLSGGWYGIEMADGSTGWIHRNFLVPAGQ